MGCDINSFAEVKRKNKWERVEDKIFPKYDDSKEIVEELFKNTNKILKNWKDSDTFDKKDINDFRSLVTTFLFKAIKREYGWKDANLLKKLFYYQPVVSNCVLVEIDVIEYHKVFKISNKLEQLNISIKSYKNNSETGVKSNYEYINSIKF